jgi:4-hydroxybenzoate polyprenyltransferase
MKLLTLFPKMARYRSSLTLVTFMLCGAVWHNRLAHPSFKLVLAAAALVCTYAALTSLNDIADESIDRVNLRGHQDRPLVTAAATRRDLLVMVALAALAGMACGFLVDPLVGVLVVLAVLLYLQYSLPPLRISHRATLTPLYLALGYTVVPYVIGVIAAGGAIGSADAIFLPGLFLLFLARIVLKDFRDREGDVLGGKTTFLLRYGKRATCAFSFAALLTGGLVLAAALAANPLVAAGLVPFLAGLLVLQRRLTRSTRVLDEVILVGLGARIGNGMLYALLGQLMLQAAGADLAAQLGMYLVVIGAYGYVLVGYLREPSSFTFGSERIQEAMSERLARSA